MNTTDLVVSLKGIGPLDPIPDPKCYIPDGLTAMGTLFAGFSSFALNQLIAAYCPHKFSRFSEALPSDFIWYGINSIASFAFGCLGGAVGFYGYQYSECHKTVWINGELKDAVVKAGEAPLSCNAEELLCWDRAKNGTENVERFVSVSGSIVQDIHKV